MTSTVLRTLGTLLVIAGAVVVGFGYLTRPSAASCQFANQVTPGSCGTNPPATTFIIAGALAIAGILMLVNAGRARS